MRLLIVLMLIVGLSGCAVTRISTPVGTYTSFKDASLEGLKITRIDPTTGESLQIEVIGATGTASTPAQVQGDTIQSLAGTVDKMVSAGVIK